MLNVNTIYFMGFLSTLSSRLDIWVNFQMIFEVMDQFVSKRRQLRNSFFLLEIHGLSKSNCCMKQFWKGLFFLFLSGNIDTYFGNGYVTELFPRWNNKHFMEKLKEKLWLDRHTRALIVETVTYNPATNYFQNVAIVFEFAPTGGVVHYNSVITFKLYR